MGPSPTVTLAVAARLLRELVEFDSLCRGVPWHRPGNLPTFFPPASAGASLQQHSKCYPRCLHSLCNSHLPVFTNGPGTCENPSRTVPSSGTDGFLEAEGILRHRVWFCIFPLATLPVFIPSFIFCRTSSQCLFLLIREASCQVEGFGYY